MFSYLITLSPEGLFAANLGFRSQLSIALDKTSSQLSNKFINEFKKFDDVKNWDEYNISPEYFNKKFSQYKKLLRKHRIKIDSSRIEEYMSFFNENNTYRIAVLQHMVEVEFKYNNLNFRNKSKFNLFIDGLESLMRMENKEIIIGISSQIEVLPGNVLYLSSEPIVDSAFNIYGMPYHYEELYSNITETYVECDVDLEDIMEEICDIVDGEFGLSFNGSFDFISKDGDEIHIKDLSNGYKQLGVLFLLMEGKGIPRNSIMILDRIDDEMDNDLQEKTAEIIIKLAKKLDLLLLINTNNEVFFNSINQYRDEISIKSYEKSKKRFKSVLKEI